VFHKYNIYNVQNQSELLEIISEQSFLLLCNVEHDLLAIAKFLVMCCNGG